MDFFSDTIDTTLPAVKNSKCRAVHSTEDLTLQRRGRVMPVSSVAHYVVREPVLLASFQRLLALKSHDQGHPIDV